MLKRTLSEQAAECFYGDERLAEWLWQSLQLASTDFATDAWRKLHEPFYNLLVEALENRYPREHRLTDVRQLIGHMCKENLLLKSDLPLLDELQSRLLQRNGDLLCYREREVQAYVRLAAGLDPTLLVGWHLAMWLGGIPQPTSHDVKRVVTAQTAFFAPLGNPSLPVAEGHVHFGGITADSTILDGYLFAGQELTQNGETSLWQRDQYNSFKSLLQRARHLLTVLLELQADSGLEPTWEKGNREYLQGWPQCLKRLSIPMQNPVHLTDWGLLSKTCAMSNVGSADWLLGEFARVMQQSAANRWLWLHLYLCSRYKSSESHPLQRAAILCFFQTVNLLRRSLIMDGQGLTRFAERYARPVLGRGGDARSRVQRIWGGKADVAEIKSMPTVFGPAFSKKISKELVVKAGLQLPNPPYIFGEHEIQLDTNALSAIQVLERWQFCGHFSRSVKYKQNQRAKTDCKALWQEAEKLMRNLQSESGWAASEFLGGKLNPNFRFQPSRWFRGLDVAGDENALKIEWFAPMLRWLRCGFKSRPDGELASVGFHLSIHAGEDYAHPASGMRHVDETVRFCEMREGDRLGHALALGIEPRRWVERQGEMILPLDEHLDNLVWLWHYASLLSGRLPLAQQVLPLLSRRIARFWRESRWWQLPNQMSSQSLGNGLLDFDKSPLRHSTADDLYQAWMLRRNCYYRWQELAGGLPIDSRETVGLPDFERLYDKTSLASQLYFARHQWLKTGEEEKLVIIRMGDESCAHANIGSKRKDNLQEDVETPAELNFMHALQDWLLTEYDQLGLIIEANPTSNVYIARLTSHTEHPIFRWLPPEESELDNGARANKYGLRRGPVRVLVNTDDPGIMPTTLRTEFLLLREAALQLGIGRTVAERWLEALRQYGMEQFYRNHLPVFESIL